MEELTSTSRIDALRKPEPLVSLVDSVKKTVNETTSITTRDEMGTLLLKYFPGHNDRSIRDFFTNHPIRWFDLIRKLSKYRKNDSEQGWYLQDEAIEEIYTTFLVRWRVDNIGERLRSALPDVISKNQELLRYASTQPSILDSGGYAFAHIEKSKRENFIRKLVCNGFIQNIEGCTYKNIDGYFEKVFPEILRHLESIFGILIPIRYCQNSWQLIKQLEKMVGSPRGEERENAFRIIQAIHAWAGLGYIQELHNTAEQVIEKLPDVLKNAKMHIGEVKHFTRDGTIIHESTFVYNNREYAISWRVKTVMSILQKQWESEEYTNVDAIRDIVGISIVYPDDTPLPEKIDIVGKVAALMPNFWYILKDKGGLKESISDVERIVREKGKNPVHISTKRGGSTNGKFENTSVSGFIKFGKVPLGTEFQIISNSSLIWKKEDDKKYKPRSAIEALIRWPKFCTPRGCISLLNKRIQPLELPNLGLTSLNELIKEMIQDNFLLPYVSQDGQTLLFTTKMKEIKFRDKFPSMKYCDSKSPYHQKMLNYIDTLL